MKKEILISVKDFPPETGAIRTYPIDQKADSPDPRNSQLAKNLSGKVSLTKLDKSYIAKYSLKTRYIIPCARCNKETTQDVSINFQKEYQKRNIAKDNIDIYPAISQELILLFPSKTLCKNDCQGLCAVCGKNLNTEKCVCKPTRKSPFEKLKEFKIKE